jgi:TolB-like protein/Tfp pilus assembly protein PilF
MATPDPDVFEFDEFRLDARERVLRRGAAAVALTPRVFDTLLYFVRSQGRVLGKEELMRAIWPDAIVEDNNLTQNVSTLRQVLGERRGENRYIVTVPGHGYRFAARVTQPLPSTPPDGSGESAVKTVAVLPFVNTSADPDNDYFCDGLAEELMNGLSRIGHVRVAARTSAFAFKGSHRSVTDIARTLGVRWVVEGSVRRSAERVRITAQLISGSDGYHVWSGRYDRDMSDIFELQDEITLAVIAALKITLLGAARPAALRHYTDSTDAYDLYLKGRYFWFKTAPGEFRKSRDYFERAVTLDPSYALGHSGLAYYYGFAASWGMMPPQDGWPRAEAAAATAITLDSALPEAHLVLAASRMVNHRDWAGAEQELQCALALNSNTAEVHSVYGLLHRLLLRFDEAIAAARRALKIDPLSVRFARNVGNILYHARRYDEAIDQYREALELDSRDVILHQDLADAYERAGAHDEAVLEWQKAIELAGDADGASMMGRVYATNGFAAAVETATRAKLERLDASAARGEFVPAMEYARSFVRLGDTDRAFAWLAKACDERNAFALYLNTDPLYDVLRADRRFAESLRGSGLPASEHPPN